MIFRQNNTESKDILFEPVLLPKRIGYECTAISPNLLVYHEEAKNKLEIIDTNTKKITLVDDCRLGRKIICPLPFQQYAVVSINRVIELRSSQNHSLLKTFSLPGSKDDYAEVVKAKLSANRDYLLALFHKDFKFYSKYCES